MILRLRALFANIMVCMSALHVLRVTLRAFATVMPGVLNIAVLLVAHGLRGPWRVRWLGCLPAIGGPRATYR